MNMKLSLFESREIDFSKVTKFDTWEFERSEGSMDKYGKLISKGYSQEPSFMVMGSEMGGTESYIKFMSDGITSIQDLREGDRELLENVKRDFTEFLRMKKSFK